MTHQKPGNSPKPTTTPIKDEDLRKADGGLAKANVAGWTNPQDARKYGAPVIIDDSGLDGKSGGSAAASVDASRAGRAQGIDGAANIKGEPWKDGGAIQI